MESGHIHNTQRRGAFAKRMTAYRFYAVMAVIFVSLMAFSSSAFAQSYTFNYSTRGSGSITDGPNSGAWSETVLGSGPGDVDGAVPGLDLNPAPADCFPTVTQTADPEWNFSHWEITQVLPAPGPPSPNTSPIWDCAGGIGHPIGGTSTYDIVAVFVPDVEFSGTDEQNGEGSNIQFTVAPTGTYPEDITVTYTIVGKGVAPDTADPASNGSDLAAYSGSFTIPANDASFTLDIGTKDDALVESSEEFTITLTGVTSTTLGQQNANLGTTVAATGRILDNDALTVEFNQANGSDDENSGGNLPEFSVTGSVATGHSVAVDATITAGGSATGGGVDYDNPTTLTVSTGTYTSTNIAIPTLAIKGDTLLEADETFELNIDATPSDVTAGAQSSTTYTITNDDTATATLAVDSAGTEGAADATYTVSLDKTNNTGSAITVDYTFTNGTAIGGGTDFTSATTSVDVLDGNNQATITVPVNDDALLEAVETFNVTLAAATSNGQVTGDTTAVTNNINSDDTATATLAVDSAGTEGTTDATYTVTLDKQNDTGSAITVDYTFTNGTAIGGGTDFTSSTTSVDVLDGNNQATITVPVNDDALLEAVETFNVTLAAATSNGQVKGDTTAVTNNINSDDTATATLAVDSAGTEGAADATYTVSLDRTNNTGSAITVDYTFTNGTAIGGGTDFTSSTTSVDVLDGNNQATITVPVNDDALLEAVETFNVTLAAATSNGQVTGDTTAVTNSINSEDTATATLAVDSAGTEGTTDATYTVTLDKQNDTGSAITVDYTFTNGTAIGGGTDFTSSTTSVDVLDGNNQATITVPVNDDALLEAVETFNVTLTAATSNGQVTGDTTAVTNSINSDDTATVSVAKTQDAAEPGTSATFLVTMTSTNNTGSAITIPYSFTDGSAGGGDYDKSGTSITIADAASTAVITVPVFDDTLLEATETYSLTVADSSDNAQVTAFGTVTQIANITSEDTATATLAVDSAGTEGTTDATYTVTLDKQNDTGSAITVDYTFTNGTAIGGGTDFTSSTTSVDVPDGNNQATITVPVIDDAFLEAVETFDVTLTAATSNGQVTGDTTAVTNSINSDDTATVSVAKTQDAAEPGTSATFLVTMTATNNTGSAITIPYSFTDGSAGGGDYDKSGTSITIADAASTAVITVPVFDDTLLEATETYSLTVADSSDNAQVTASGTVTQIANITSEDTATVRLTANTAGAENNAPGSPTAATFTVTMDSANYTGSDITVNYSFADGSAVGGTDFNNVGSSVAIADGSATAVISVPVLEDALLESTETFSVTLTGTDNGQVAVASDGTQTRETTITSDDTATATLAVGVPGAEPATAATFTVSLDKQNDTGSDITVTYAFTDGTATGGGVDYTSSTTTVDVLAGQSNATITVPVNDDALLEATETFNVTLAAATSNAQVTGDTTAVTNNITSDETATVSVSTIQGAAEPLTPAAFLVTMTSTNNTGTVITIPYSFTNGSATGGADFDNTGTDITIANATSSAVITVPVTDDALLEATETFSLTIADSSDNTQVTASATDTDVANITSDDTATATLAVGVAGAEPATAATYTVSLDKQNDTGSAITVTYAFTDGTATGGGVDYTSSTTTVDVLAGQSNATITVPVNDDALLEATETLNVTLAAATSNTQVTGDTTAVTNNITSDDTVTVSVAKTTDAAEPGTPATFTVTMTSTNNTGSAITIPYSFTNGTATGGADFVNTGTDITIADAASTALITVPVTDDTLLEATETFSLTIADSSDNAQVTAFGTVTDIANITSEDLATVNLTANTTGAENGAGATTPATFTITMNRTNNTGSDITVNYSFADGSAVGGTDFNNAGTSAVIGDGLSTATITVPVLEDTLLEATETFSATLTGTDNGQVSVASDGSETRVTDITSDDLAIVNLTANTAGVENGAGATTPATFTVTMDRFNNTGSDITVSYGLASGSAIGGTDFDNTGTNVAIIPGSNTATISVPVLEDTIVEASETFTATVTGTDNGQAAAAIDGTQSRVTSITDDDTATFTIDDVSVNESTGTVDFTVSLSNPVDIPVTIDVNYTDGSTTAGDFNHATGYAIFSALSTTDQPVAVSISDDNIVELDETFSAAMTINAGTPVGARTVDVSDTGTGTIVSDNDTATFGISNVSVNESAGTMDFTVLLSNPLDVNVDVDVSYTDDTATGGGTDYDSTTDTVTFLAGNTVGQTATVPSMMMPLSRAMNPLPPPWLSTLAHPLGHAVAILATQLAASLSMTIYLP